MEKFSNINPALARPWLVVPRDWRRPHVAEDHSILWDADRAYGQLWPRPTPQAVAEYYRTENYYTHKAKGALPGSAKYGLSQRLQTKLSWYADKGIDPDVNWWAQTLGGKPLRILEVGCGNGSTLSALASLGHAVHGVEPDLAALEVAQSAGLDVREGTAEALPMSITEDRFDAVIFMHVLEHCINPWRAIANVVELLRDDGLLVVEVPNNECLGREVFGSLWYWLDVPRHLNFFTTRSLSDLFVSVGLEVEDTSYRGYCRQFSAEWKNMQHRIAKTFGMGQDRRVRGSSYWSYLRRSAPLPPNRKYDSVRLVGRLPRHRSP